MTISEKKIELVQHLLLLQDKSVLFEIEKLIASSFRAQNVQNIDSAPHLEKDVPLTFEAWVAQFEAVEEPDTADEFGLTPTEFRQRIWSAEQGKDMSLETFWERVAQN